MSDGEEPARTAGHSDGDALLRVEDLEKHYPITEGVLRREVGRVRAVDGVSFEVADGETLGVIGESGSGKSTVATAMLRIEEPTGGRVVFDGEDVTAYDDPALNRFRRRVQMVFQDPNSSFDPRLTIGESVAEPLRVHGLRDATRRRAVVTDLLERLGLSADDADRYPHELSGGQKQRAALARALVLNPDLLVADEPVSALDVSVQAEILSLLASLKREFDLSLVLISHDMSVVREICDRVAVLYLGEVVERGPTERLFEDPQHPYTRALVESVPTTNPRAEGRRTRLTGDVPDPANAPSGCSFHPRCPAVVQPEAYDFEQSTWRAVLDLRVALADGSVTPETARDALDRDASADGVPAAVRERFGIPDSLGDPDAEAILSRALASVADGDVEGAAEQLAEAFGTVCERRAPALEETAAGHPAACHRHDEGAPELNAEGPDPRRT